MSELITAWLVNTAKALSWSANSVYIQTLLLFVWPGLCCMQWSLSNAHDIRPPLLVRNSVSEGLSVYFQ